MIHRIAKLILFLSSFLPLYLLLIIQNIQIMSENRKVLSKSQFLTQFFHNENKSVTIFWITLFSLITLSIIGIIIFNKYFLNSDGVSERIIVRTIEKEDVLGYIITYIVPILSMDIRSARSLLINFLLFIIIGFFYIKNNQLYLNPVFVIMGYNIYSSEGIVYITKINARKLKEISREKIFVNVKNVAENIYIVNEDL